MECPEGYLIFTTLMGDVYFIEHHAYEDEIKQYNLALAFGEQATVENFEAGNTGWVHSV